MPYKFNPFTSNLDQVEDVSSFGDVTGPASSTQYAVAIYADTSGKVLDEVASLGSAGDVLTSNGAGLAPTYQTPATPGMVLFDTQIVSNAAEAAFIDLDIANYMLVIDYAYPNSGSTYLKFQVSGDNGSTWTTTGYDSDIFFWEIGTTTTNNAGASTGHIYLTGNMGTGNNQRASGTINIQNLREAQFTTVFGQTFFYGSSVVGFCVANVMGRQTTASLSNAFRILANSGNITGNFYLYKLAV